jgi:hypothetical protein
MNLVIMGGDLNFTKWEVLAILQQKLFHFYKNANIYTGCNGQY